MPYLLKKKTTGKQDMVKKGSYPYYTVEGVPFMLVDRFEGKENEPGKKRPKSFVVSSLQNGRKVYKKPVGLAPLYGAHLIANNPGLIITLLEGEEKTNRTNEYYKRYSLPYLAISWSCGCDGIESTDFAPLDGKRLILWADNDENGKQAMLSIAARCPNSEISFVHPPEGKPQSWDIANAIDEDLNIKEILDKASKVPYDVTLSEAKNKSTGNSLLLQYLSGEITPPEGSRHSIGVQCAGMIRKQNTDLQYQNAQIRSLLKQWKLPEAEINEILHTTREWSNRKEVFIFPEIETINDQLSNPPEPDPVLIEGILRMMHKLVISGPSKTGKTFMLLALALAIATGRKWLDTFSTHKSPILYINLEISKPSFILRLKEVADALSIPYSEINLLKVIHMRGINICSEEYLSQFFDYLSSEKWGAIVLDPMYKLYPLERGFEENKAESLIRMFNLIDKLIAQSGAAVLMCTHTAKGLQGGKAAIDRASGSGVWARDPDAILSLVEANSEDGGYKLEFALREFACPAPIGLQFNYPIHERDKSLDKVEVRGQKKAGRTQAFTADMLSSVWKKLADQNGFASFDAIIKLIGAGSQKTFSNRISELNKNDKNVYNLRVCKNGINGDLSNL